MNGATVGAAVLAALSGVYSASVEDWRVLAAWAVFAFVVIVAAMVNDKKKEKR